VPTPRLPHTPLAQESVCQGGEKKVLDVPYSLIILKIFPMDMNEETRTQEGGMPPICSPHIRILLASPTSSILDMSFNNFAGMGFDCFSSEENTLDGYSFGNESPSFATQRDSDVAITGSNGSHNWYLDLSSEVRRPSRVPGIRPVGCVGELVLGPVHPGHGAQPRYR